MKISHHSDFNIGTDESFTVTMWVNFAKLEAESNQRLISKRNYYTGIVWHDHGGWELHGGNSSGQFIGVNTPNQDNKHNNSFTAYTTFQGAVNNWVHTALVVDRTAGRMYLYVNGVKTNESSTDISSWSVTNENDLLIGALYNSICLCLKNVDRF